MMFFNYDYIKFEHQKYNLNIEDYFNNMPDEDHLESILNLLLDRDEKARCKMNQLGGHPYLSHLREVESSLANKENERYDYATAVRANHKREQLETKLYHAPFVAGSEPIDFKYIMCETIACGRFGIIQLE
jgi:serine/threonine protein kinase